MTLNRRGVRVAAVVLAVLAATAPAVAVTDASEVVQAADGLVVGSEHTDFGTGNEAAPTTLTNLFISGSGDDASISLSGKTSLSLVEGWEDGDTTLDANGWSGWTGDIQNQQSSVINGSRTGEVPSSNEYAYTEATRDSDSTSTLVQTVRFPDQTSDTAGGDEDQSQIGLLDSSGTYLGLLAFIDHNQNIEWEGNVLRNSWSPDTNYRVQFEFDFDTDEVTIYINGVNEGTYSLRNSVSGWATVRYARDTRGSSESSSMFIDDLKSQSTVSPSNTGTYLSANHSVSHADTAAANITSLSNASATITAEYWDGSTWVTSNDSTATTPGSHSVQLPTVSSSTWRVNVTVVNQTTNGEPEFTLADESILFSNHDPSAANIEPPDDKKLRDDDIAEFNVSVVDEEFGTAQGDTVTAELVYDGSVVATESVSSNTTVSTTHKIVDGGDHTWYWRLSDSYGAVTETEQRIVKAPATLEIRDEQNASQLIQSQTEVTVTFFGRSGEIITKSTTDGTVDLTGLPINRRFTVRADAGNFTSRRTILESLYRQQSVYLIDENATTVTVEFQLEDDTGNFPAAESELLIQRALDSNGDGNSSYRTVSADQFGATGSYSATLVQDERYRLVVRNDDGDRRSLGTYIPRESRIQPLPIGRVEFSTEVENGIRFDASVENPDGDRYLRVYYQDVDNRTERVTFNATYRDGTSIAVQTFTGPLSSGIATFDLPNNTTSNGIRVQYSADMTTGETQTGRVLLGGVNDFADELGVDKRLRILTGVGAILAVTGLTVIAFPSAAALVAVGTASLLHLIGWITTSPLALGLAGFVAVAYAFGDRS